MRFCSAGKQTEPSASPQTLHWALPKRSSRTRSRLRTQLFPPFPRCFLQLTHTLGCYCAACHSLHKTAIAVSPSSLGVDTKLVSRSSQHDVLQTVLMTLLQFSVGFPFCPKVRGKHDAWGRGGPERGGGGLEAGRSCVSCRNKTRARDHVRSCLGERRKETDLFNSRENRPWGSRMCRSQEGGCRGGMEGRSGKTPLEAAVCTPPPVSSLTASGFQARHSTGTSSSLDSRVTSDPYLRLPLSSPECRSGP